MSNSTCSFLLGKLKESLNRGDEAASIDSTEDGQIRASFCNPGSVSSSESRRFFKQCCSSLGYSPLDHVELFQGRKRKTWQASMNANVPCVSRRHLDGAWKHSCPFRNVCLMWEPLNNTQARTWGVLLPSAEGKYNRSAFKKNQDGTVFPHL